MKLLHLTLTNFQGIRALRVEPDGKRAAIYGDNGTGKTTVFNAFTWLLFGAASTGAKDFSPKTKGADGDLHGLEHSVEGCLLTDDGKIVTLKRAFKEVYKKKRGSAAEEFDGHTTDFRVNGVPCKEKEYADTVTALFGSQERAKMLSVPFHFAETMSWQERRKTLLELIGTVDDETVIASDPDLSELEDILRIPGGTEERYTVEEYLKIAAAKKTEINRELTALPARMDEASRATPGMPGESEEEIRSRISAARKKKSEAEAKRTALKNGGAAASIRVQIENERVNLATAQSEERAKEFAATKTHREAIARLQGEKLDVQAKQSELARALDAARGEVAKMKSLRETLIAEYRAVQSEVWDESGTVCPTCGRPLPAEEVDRARAAFNLRKSERLSAINERGKKEASASAVEALEVRCIEIKGRLTAAAERSEQLDAEIAAEADKITALTKDTPTEREKAIYARLCALEASLASEDASEELGALEKEIRGTETVVEHEEKKLAAIDLAKAQKLRLDELRAREKDLAAAYAELEKGVFLSELFIRRKVGMLTDKINGVFANVRFSLFAEQVNGGLREECEVMVPCDGRLIPFRFANNAARINAGLEIIDVLGTRFGVRCPVFVDNAESVTRIIDTNMQVIRLVVSDKDQVLRLEKE